MKTLISNILAIVLAGAIMAIVFKACDRMAKADGRKPIDPSWATTAGTLVHARNHVRGTTLLKYYFNGRFYQEVSSRYNIEKTKYTVIGQKYLIRVNPKDPSEYIPIESRPVFTDDEMTDTVYGRIVSTKEWTDFEDNERIGLVFEYNVGDDLYESFQEVPREDSVIFKNLWVGQHFSVRYWEEDIQRAVIYLDSISSWPITQ